MDGRGKLGAAPDNDEHAMIDYLLSFPAVAPIYGSVTVSSTPPP